METFYRFARGNFHELHPHLRSRTIVSLTFPNDFSNLCRPRFHVPTIHIRGKSFPIAFCRNRNHEKKDDTLVFVYLSYPIDYRLIDLLLVTRYDYSRIKYIKLIRIYSIDTWNLNCEKFSRKNCVFFQSLNINFIQILRNNISRLYKNKNFIFSV